MIVQCPSCETKFRIADGKVTSTGVKVRCSKCAQVFVVRKDAVAASLESIAAAPAPGDAPPSPPGARIEPVDPPETVRANTQELFADPGVGPPFSPPTETTDRLSGPKDPFAFTGFDAGPPAWDPPDGPTEDAGEDLSGHFGPPEGASTADGSDAWGDPFEPSESMPAAGPIGGEDPFSESPAPRFAPPPRAATGLEPPPLPGVEDPSVRFPAPAGLADAPAPGASPLHGLSDDPFAEDPFDAPSGEYAMVGPSPFEVPPTPSTDVPATDAPAADGGRAAAPPVALGRIAPMRVQPESADLAPPDPQVARGPTPVPDLKWPPRVGLLLGVVLAVLWLRPGAFDWADEALGGGGSARVRTVDLEARPYALDLADPQWVVLGTAETRGRAYPDGLDARVRVRASGTLVADLQVPVGLVPPVEVLADGPEAVEAYWRAQRQPPLAAASRSRFLALLPELHGDPELLTFEVEYSAPTTDGEAAAP